MSNLFSSPKLPKDTSAQTAQQAEADRKKRERQARDTFLTNQQKRAQFGRQSTVLAQDEQQDATLLGG